jgi:hypothetical protein
MAIESLFTPRTGRNAGAVTIRVEVNDPEVAAELRRHAEGDERDAFALAALRIGVLALRNASGQMDANAMREAGRALVGEMRDLLTARAAELTTSISGALTQYLDPQGGLFHQRVQSLVQKDGEIDRLLAAHLGADDSLLARSLASHLGEGSPVFKLLSPTDANGLRAQLAQTLEGALAEQRKHILREFSLDHADSALKRLVDELTASNGELTKQVHGRVEVLARELSLDDERSAMSRLSRLLKATIDAMSKSNVELMTQVRETLARLDARRQEAARSTGHGRAFEQQLGDLLAAEAQRLGDVFEATGETTGVIKNCKVGDHVVELGAESAAAHARIAWEAKEKIGYDVRRALEEIDVARRNRQAQVGVFVFSKRTAPPGIEALARHGSDIVVVWDAEDVTSDVVVRAAYSLARALAVRERRTNDESQEAIAEIERATRAIEKQAAYVDDIRKWAETAKSSGEKIVDRATRMTADLAREIDRLDAQLASLKTRPG